MVAKQRVPIDVVQLALVRVRAKGLLALQRGIHAEDSVQPFLHGVPGGISVDSSNAREAEVDAEAEVGRSDANWRPHLRWR